MDDPQVPEYTAICVSRKVPGAVRILAVDEAAVKENQTVFFVYESQQDGVAGSPELNEHELSPEAILPKGILTALHGKSFAGVPPGHGFVMHKFCVV